MEQQTDTSAKKFRASVGDLILEAMNHRGITISELSQRLECTYEHARRLARGESIPSKLLMRELSGYLEIPLHDMQTKAVSDHIRLKHGTIPLELANKNPELEPIERAWVHLTPEQKSSVTTMIEALARQGRQTS